MELADLIIPGTVIALWLLGTLARRSASRRSDLPVRPLPTQSLSWVPEHSGRELDDALDTYEQTRVQIAADIEIPRSYRLQSDEVFVPIDPLDPSELNSHDLTSQAENISYAEGPRNESEPDIPTLQPRVTIPRRRYLSVLSTRGGLREAIIAQVVLGQPRGLEGFQERG